MSEGAAVIATRGGGGRLALLTRGGRGGEGRGEGRGWGWWREWGRAAGGGALEGGSGHQAEARGSRDDIGVIGVEGVIEPITAGSVPSWMGDVAGG